MQSKPPQEALTAAQILECLLKPVKKKQLHDAIVTALCLQPPGHKKQKDTTTFLLNPSRPLPSRPAPTLPAETPGPKRPWRVLIAEDNRVNQKLAHRLVARLGYEAMSGRPAVVLRAVCPLSFALHRRAS